MSSLLIIDDELNVCYSLQRAIESATLKIRSAGTAREGIDSIRQSGPDAVILDVRLPDMSGLEAHAMIRQIDARLPVVMITAHGTTETAIQAIGECAFEYLFKPLDLEQLRDVVARAIHLSRINRNPAMPDAEREPLGYLWWVTIRNFSRLFAGGGVGAPPQLGKYAAIPHDRQVRATPAW